MSKLSKYVSVPQSANPWAAYTAKNIGLYEVIWGLFWKFWNFEIWNWSERGFSKKENQFIFSSKIVLSHSNESQIIKLFTNQNPYG